MELEVRHLRVVCAIGDSGSLTKAAAALRLSQPGLSAQLRRIESLLGGRLFERGAHGVQPTVLGELVLSRARALLPGIEDLLSATILAARSGQVAQRLRLASVTAPLLGAVIDALRHHLPDAEITTRAHHASQPLLADLTAGRLEAAVVGDSPGYEIEPAPRVEVREVVTEPVFALLPANHPHAVDSAVDLRDLADDDWAVPRPESDRTSEYWVTAMGRRPRIPYEAEGRLLVELVRGGHAVSLCQALFDEVPGVVVRPLAGNPLWYRHLLAWHRNGPLAGIGDDVLSRVRTAYQRMSARHPVYARWLRRTAS